MSSSRVRGRPPATRTAATSGAGGRVDVTPKISRKARPTIQPTTSEQARAASVRVPESKVVTRVAMTTVVAMGEIHLRPEMSATVSSATIETMTMSSGPVCPVVVGRVRVLVMNPPLPDWTRTARTMTRIPATTAAEQVGADADGQEQHSDTAHPAEERQQQPGQAARGISEVLLDRPPGAGGDVGDDQPEDEQHDRHGEAHAVGGPAHPLGDRRLDDL